MHYNKDTKLLEDNNTIGNSHNYHQNHLQNSQQINKNLIMRLVARNRRNAAFGVLIVIALTMVVFKYSEFRPTCLLKEESMMVRDEVSEFFCLNVSEFSTAKAC